MRQRRTSSGESIAMASALLKSGGSETGWSGLFGDRFAPAGLRHYEGAIDEATEARLAKWIDEQPWIEDLSRRVQHYGWRYDYRARGITSDAHLGPLPHPLKELADGFVARGFLGEQPDQAIVNEYLPGQGIAAHIDCAPCFGEESATLSLLDSYPMEFSRPSTDESCTVWLAQRSLCVMAGECRWSWRHGIAKRKSDPVSGGGRKSRGRRVSITFRRVVISRGAKAPACVNA
ncbi:MAG: alpha-ketoglutarate-dependent dioxygenase AlkB [Armatimonadetes bacterium]|nr:alpha-ketoglutarate-dependent dioxygenase AlkB [Armatimonadota bacterium]